MPSRRKSTVQTAAKLSAKEAQAKLAAIAADIRKALGALERYALANGGTLGIPLGPDSEAGSKRPYTVAEWCMSEAAFVASEMYGGEEGQPPGVQFLEEAATITQKELNAKFREDQAKERAAARQRKVKVAVKLPPERKPPTLRERIVAAELALAEGLPALARLHLSRIEPEQAASASKTDRARLDLTLKASGDALLQSRRAMDAAEMLYVMRQERAARAEGAGHAAG